jgi:predicted ATPase
VPEEVRGLIRRRVADVSPEATSLLRIAAVIGRDLDVRVLSSAMALSPTQVVDLLSETERAGAIVERRDAIGTYIFAHDLLRETLYDDLPAAERMDLHRVVAGALEELFGNDLMSHLAEIAHHLVLAGPLGDPERAIDFSIRAADRSRDVLAYEDAAQLYGQALRLLQPEASSERTARVQLKLGDALSRAGDSDGAYRNFEQAAAIARRVGSDQILGLAALGYGAAELRTTPGRPPGWFREGASRTTIALLEEALASLPEEDSPVRARALAMLATELYASEQRDRRAALSRQALEMATRLGEPDVQLEALHARHWATFAPDTVHERLDNAERMLELSASSSCATDRRWTPRSRRWISSPGGPDSRSMHGTSRRCAPFGRSWRAA